MKIFSVIELMKTHAKNMNKWCVYIQVNWKDGKEIHKAAPYLKKAYPNYLEIPKELILTFNTEKEMERCFNQTIGHKGPTKDNRYIGKCRIPALTCSNVGNLLNENC